MKAYYKKKSMNSVICVIMLISIMLSSVACSNILQDIQAEDVTEGIKAENVEGKHVDDSFKSNAADFSIDLFKRSYDDKENSLISPLSVMLALSMTANGADKNTLRQMEQVLGSGIPLDELNEYLYEYVKGLASEKKSQLNIANSLWFRDNDSLNVDKDFLQRNANYYDAEVYKAAFDKQTLNDINNWTDDKTDGMIDKIIDEISPDAIMYLINAIVFDGKWEQSYGDNDIEEGSFTTIDGDSKEVEFMKSDEVKLLGDDKAIGFMKPYDNNHYSLVALLPSEDISIDEYISSLTGKVFTDMLDNAKEASVKASMPMFEYDYDIEMKNLLVEMGIEDAFSTYAADFTRMANSSIGDIYISEVLHK
ncbi:MAG TPA: serpin family protein, partial [Bacillota bacterium]|nr:serpin family protein [Bacillota bacterium]